MPFETDLENEKEWRRELQASMKDLTNEMKEIQKNQVELKIAVSNLQLKVAFFGMIFGAVGTMVVNFVAQVFKSKPGL